MIKNEINKLLKQKERIIIAIDGRCGSGKTTLAAQLKKEPDCNVIPADHFFLRPEQRTSERYAQPGGNIDYERLESEVLVPLSKGGEFSYKPFDCSSGTLAQPVFVPQKAINIIEGSYSCHPRLFGYYDLTIFLTVDREEQLRRIERRNGSEMLKMFKEKWIPLEEKYFAEYNVEEKCNIIIENSCKE